MARRAVSAGPSRRAARARAAADPCDRAMLFEIAWEVCQQVGGIYTVIRSKVPHMVQRWGRRY